jgi:hypothetical protein
MGADGAAVKREGLVPCGGCSRRFRGMRGHLWRDKRGRWRWSLRGCRTCAGCGELEVTDGQAHRIGARDVAP